MKLTLRDLFWLVLVCAMALGWLNSSYQSVWQFRYTGRELDLAIAGRGYFIAVNSETGEDLYTRQGNLSCNASGELCLIEEDRQWQIVPGISIPSDFSTIQVSKEGEVLVHFSDGSPAVQVGQLQLATFMNPEALLEVDPGWYIPTRNSGTPLITTPGRAGGGLIHQRWRER